jgi:hypothetical protein
MYAAGFSHCVCWQTSPNMPPTEPIRISSCQSEIIDPDTLMIYQLARAGDSA